MARPLAGLGRRNVVRELTADLERTTWLVLVPSAIALTIVRMVTVERLLGSRSSAARRGYPDDSDRDLFALGLGNVAEGNTEPAVPNDDEEGTHGPHNR